METSINPNDLLRLSEAYGISLEDAQAFLLFDQKSTGRATVENWVAEWFANNKERFDADVKKYNRLNPSAKILTNKEKLIKKGLLVLAAVVVAAAAYFAYKKFKK